MIKNITKEEAIEAIENLLDIKNKPLSKTIKKDGDAAYMIDKRELSRIETLRILGEYFEDKNIVGGCCKINALTLLYTIVEVKDLPIRSY